MWGILVTEEGRSYYIYMQFSIVITAAVVIVVFLAVGSVGTMATYRGSRFNMLL